MFMFGIRCVRCNHEIIAPHRTEFLRSFAISGTARDVRLGSVLSAISDKCEVGERSRGAGRCFSRLNGT